VQAEINWDKWIYTSGNAPMGVLDFTTTNITIAN
jgi:hypothetical protein